MLTSRQLYRSRCPQALLVPSTLAFRRRSWKKLVKTRHSRYPYPKHRLYTLVVLPHWMSSLQRPKSAILMWPSLSSNKFSSCDGNDECDDVDLRRKSIKIQIKIQIQILKGLKYKPSDLCKWFLCGGGSQWHLWSPPHKNGFGPAEDKIQVRCETNTKVGLKVWYSVILANLWELPLPGQVKEKFTTIDIPAKV